MMAVERCCVCDTLVDLDTCVEGIVYLGDKAYCPECIDYDELTEDYQVVYEQCSKLSRENARLKEDVTAREEIIEECIIWIKRMQPIKDRQPIFLDTPIVQAIARKGG